MHCTSTLFPGLQEGMYITRRFRESPVSMITIGRSLECLTGNEQIKCFAALTRFVYTYL